MFPRSLLSAFLLAVAACGAPGSDAVFANAMPGRGAGRASGAVTPAPSGPEMEIRAFSGLYRRLGDQAHFQPCGQKEALEISGTREGRGLLADRFRWMSVWQGHPLFAVLQGAIVTDTLPSPAGDSLPPKLVKRFFVTGVDSLRAWDGDCGGMKVTR